MEKIILEGITVKQLMDAISKSKPIDEKILTHEQARKELQISQSHYNRLKNSGLLPVRGIGTLERILKSELIESMEKIKKYLDVV